MKSIFGKLLLFISFLNISFVNSQTIMNIYENNGVVSQIPISSIDSVNYSLLPPSAMYVYQQNGVMLQFVLNLIDSVTYTINNPGVLANLSTNPISTITSTAASSGGNIVNDGGSLITHRGVVWNINPNPTTANSIVNSGLGLGNYTSSLVGLIPNTTYFVRAYAINSAGTAYGNEISFTTSQAPIVTSTPGPGVNFGGYFYPSIILGNGQEWMAENLRTTFYANGDPIPNVTDANQWQNLTTGAWAHYNNDSQYENPYGKLYNWYAVDDSRNVCPTGWHVPSDAEWTVLSDYLGGEAVAGGKMKSTGTAYWFTPNTDATNESGFSGLPGGPRYDDGTFNDIGYGGYWWSSSEYVAAGYAWGRGLYYSSGDVGRTDYSKPSGFSVRCIKD
jgi:uncharacterized protein (TIGR02145 family)